jgi:hypothetical protein
MYGGRGFATAVVLVLIALAALAVSRRLERERRLIGTLRRRDALAAGRALPLTALSDPERETAEDLVDAGVLRRDGGRVHLDLAVLASFRRRRIGLAVTGALAALGLAAGLAALILTR